MDIDLLKNVQPEDIEDISERFLPLWQEGRDSDSVKKIRLPDSELFLIAIVEHQSGVYYDMAFKLLRYVVLPSVYKGTHALNHDIWAIFCVALNRRTSSTPQSSALKITQISMVRVVESERN